MVRYCRTPSVARQLFSANDLSGWALDSVPYTPTQLKRRKRDAMRRRLDTEESQVVKVRRIVTPLEVGIRLA